MSDSAIDTFIAENKVPRFELDSDESAQIDSLVDDAVKTLDTTGIPDLAFLSLLAHRLPERLRAMAVDFRLNGRPYGGFVINGLPVDESRLEPTPPDYTARDKDDYTQRVETLLLLMGSLVGDPFSFATQQRGRLILDVFPLKGHEQKQLGTSSDVVLEWHNEDAFLDTRPDWIMLLGLRNHDATATTWCPVHEVPVADEDREVLFENRFILLPDDSHTSTLNDEIAGDNDPQADSAFSEIARMGASPPKIPILSGNVEAPFVQIDPPFMEYKLDDAEAEAALARFMESTTQQLRDVVLLPGDLLIIDNKRAVHGRRPFAPRYDGTDRWLKRILLTADLRKSEGMRSGTHGRAIHTRGAHA